MEGAAAQTQLHMPYEGAGFLLKHQGKFILGVRLQTNSEAQPELEYMGGKAERNDKNSPATTAYNELVEELGGPILDVEWESRARVLHLYQPYSQIGLHRSEPSKVVPFLLLEDYHIDYQRFRRVSGSEDRPRSQITLQRGS